MLEVLNKIGKGSSCCVYKAQDKKTGEIYALKQSLSPDNESLFKKEIMIYRLFNNESPYIIKYYDCFKAKNEENKKCLYLQLEYCQYGSIRDIIKHARKKDIVMTETEISSVIYMVLLGIKFIHSKKLINRDIKGRNILITKDGEVKLCDFGICRIYHKNRMKEIRGGSPYWMAPEILKKEEYNQNIDIWALGITCIELAEFEPPYSDFGSNEVIKQIIKSPPQGLSKPKKWSKEFNDFIRQCLLLDKNKRPMADELLKHDFITMIDKKNLNRKLILLNYLSRVGYKVIYNKKKNIFSPSIHLINNKTTVYRKRNRITSNILLTEKDSIDYINNEFNYNFNTNKKPLKNLKQNLIININNFLSNNNNGFKTNRKSTSRKSNLINKKIYVKTRSVERGNIKKDINYLYKTNLTSINNDDYANNINILLSEPKFKNKRNSRCSDLNNNYVNIINEEDELENEKIFDLEIKNLMKERDKEINNIIVKYQNKIDEMKSNKNIYYKKRVILSGSDSKNNQEENYHDKVLSCRGKINYSNSSSSLNKITTGCDEYKNNEYY